MKLIFFIILSTFIYLSASCGSQCNKNKVPNETLTGNLMQFNFFNDMNSSNKYNVGGTINIINDCVFEVKNFYAYPEMKNAKWYCIKSLNNNENILISKDNVNSIDKKSAKTVTYDISEADKSCPASLINDCPIISLIDEKSQIIASSNIIKISKSFPFNDDGFHIKNIESKNEKNTSDNSDKNGSETLLYVILGISGGVGFACLFALGYILSSKSSKYNDEDSNDSFIQQQQLLLQQQRQQQQQLQHHQRQRQQQQLQQHQRQRQQRQRQNFLLANVRYEEPPPSYNEAVRQRS